MKSKVHRVRAGSTNRTVTKIRSGGGSLIQQELKKLQVARENCFVKGIISSKSGIWVSTRLEEGAQLFICVCRRYWVWKYRQHLGVVKLSLKKQVKRNCESLFAQWVLYYCFYSMVVIGVMDQMC